MEGLNNQLQKKGRGKDQVPNAPTKKKKKIGVEGESMEGEEVIEITPTNASKKQWTRIEDVVLVECMVLMKEKLKWKAENGFKAGKLVNEKLPRANILVHPHIQSRVKLLKKQFIAIKEMRANGSGFGWNDKDKCIQCHQDVFDDYVRSHPNAKGLRNKAFPHYEELLDIFGTDSATGANAEAPADSVKAMDTEEFGGNEVHQGWEGDEEVDGDATEPIDTATGTINDEVDAFLSKPTSKEDGSKKGVNSKKKTKLTGTDGYGELCAEIKSYTSIYKEMYEETKTIAAYFKKECDEKDKKKELIKELMNFQWLNKLDMMKVGKHIMKEEVKLDLYFALPNELKEDFVKEEFKECNK